MRRFPGTRTTGELILGVVCCLGRWLLPSDRTSLEGLQGGRTDGVWNLYGGHLNVDFGAFKERLPHLPFLGLFFPSSSLFLFIDIAMAPSLARRHRKPLTRVAGSSPFIFNLTKSTFELYLHKHYVILASFGWEYQRCWQGFSHSAFEERANHPLEKDNFFIGHGFLVKQITKFTSNITRTKICFLSIEWRRWCWVFSYKLLSWGYLTEALV